MLGTQRFGESWAKGGLGLRRGFASSAHVPCVRLGQERQRTSGEETKGSAGEEEDVAHKRVCGRAAMRLAYMGQPLLEVIKPAQLCHTVRHSRGICKRARSIPCEQCHSRETSDVQAHSIPVFL